MLKLYSKHTKLLGKSSGPKRICRLTENQDLPKALRSKHILLLKNGYEGDCPEGFSGVFTLRENGSDRYPDNTFLLSEEYAYLGCGDVVKFSPDNQSFNVIYRRSSKHNSILVTERCNNYCVMCSQPPKDKDDSYIIDELKEAIPLMDEATREIGITGGEPTILGPRSATSRIADRRGSRRTSGDPDWLGSRPWRTAPPPGLA